MRVIGMMLAEVEVVFAALGAIEFYPHRTTYLLAMRSAQTRGPPQWLGNDVFKSWFQGWVGRRHNSNSLGS
jgi:hypothetical protein